MDRCVHRRSVVQEVGYGHAKTSYIAVNILNLAVA